MNAFFYSELTACDPPNKAEFQVERKVGWVFMKAYPLLAGLFLLVNLVTSFSEKYPADSIARAVGAAILLAGWAIPAAFGRKYRIARLAVTRERIEASGLGVGSKPWRFFKVSVPLAQVDWLGFVPSNPGGLYLSRGLMDNICVLPGLSREQAGIVITTILRRFPELRTKIQPDR
jgi:hypothetical protein